MKLLFVHSHIFKYDEDGIFYSDGKLTYDMWKSRYLISFDGLVVAGRGQKISNVNMLNKSSGQDVSHVVLPSLSSVKNHFKNKKDIKKKILVLIKKTDLLVARMPSEHAYIAIKIARKLNKPYVVEVVGDAFTSLWTHGNIFGKILAPVTFLRHRSIIKKSPYLIYVTEDYLQKRYPHNNKALVINASNVDIKTTNETVLINKVYDIREKNGKNDYNIGLIGSYSSRYKGLDTAIKAIYRLKVKGYNCSLFILGDGKKEWLIKLAKSLQVENQVFFTDSLPGGKKVLKWLDKLDIYIQPSLTEGLPRALIEAMSRGLPCVASSVGGIPELLDGQFIHNPNSPHELSIIIEKLILDNNTMVEQAKVNFNKAKDYSSNILNKRREEFWTQIISEELIK